MTSSARLDPEALAQAGVRVIKDDHADRIAKYLTSSSSDPTPQDIEDFTDALREGARRGFEAQMEIVKKRIRERRRSTGD